MRDLSPTLSRALRRLGRALGAAALLSVLIGTVAQAELRVVATIAPAHSLTAQVMRGAGVPHLLLPPGVSPHAYALRPSDVSAVDRADVVIWMGPHLEPWLRRALRVMAADAVVLTLPEVPGVTTRPPRSGAAWGAGWGGAGFLARSPRPGDIDPHLWLDPENARAWVAAIAATLSEHDPTNATLYQANAAEADRALAALSEEIRETLAPVRDRSFIVFHDAYQYFERRFDMRATGAVALGAARRPSAARVAAAQEMVRAADVVCVFTEPQFPPRLAAVVAEGGDARLGALDPLGADLTPGPAFYGGLMRALSVALAECLAG